MKTLRELEEKINRECREKYRSSDGHCDTWMGFRFTVSENGKFAAYIIKRMYETYQGWPNDEDYNQVCVANLEEEISVIKSTSLEKFLRDEETWEDKHIVDIVFVSNEGIVTYKTGDDKTHTL